MECSGGYDFYTWVALRDHRHKGINMAFMLRFFFAGCTLHFGHGMLN